jgi:hypothetical protein
MSTAVPRVFVSYSHQDAKPLERLKTHLAPLIRKGVIHFWDDTQISAGRHWRTEIERAIDSAAAAVLLVSAEFLASDFIHANELRPILDAWAQREVKLYWVLLSPCNYRPYPELERIQAVNPGLKPLNKMGWEQQEALWSKLRESIEHDLDAPQGLTPFARTLESAPGPPRITPAIDEGPVPLDSPFYVERDVDRRILACLETSGVTITVKGHHQSGKSSLLARLGFWARGHGRVTCMVDFSRLNRAVLADKNALFQAIAGTMAEQLGRRSDVATSWSAFRNPRSNLTRFLEKRVLSRVDGPVLLLFDEVDRLARYREPSEGLFSTLRACHNQRAYDLDGQRGWKRLGMVVAHVSDPSFWIRDQSQTPFNVGERFELDDFDAAQVAHLNELYGFPLHSQEEVGRLMVLVGGLPYLVRLALYTMAAHRRSLADLEDTATREDGPFASHLHQLQETISADEALRRALRSIVDQGSFRDEMALQQLASMGLIEIGSRDQVEFRAKLYEDYFRKQMR